MTAVKKKRTGKNAGQIILRWHIQEGVIAIPKSVHQERLVSNIDVWDFELTERGEWTDFLLNLKVES